jgi:hypothetical protein
MGQLPYQIYSVTSSRQQFFSLIVRFHQLIMAAFSAANLFVSLYRPLPELFVSIASA